VGGFLILIVLFGAAWLLFVLPARRRRMSHSAMQDSIEPGDEIITAGGLHGSVKTLGEDTLELEIAPGVVATLDRRAVAAVAREVEVEVEVEPVQNLDENPPLPG
jgi:preprotein translocase subunit YajC